MVTFMAQPRICLAKHFRTDGVCTKEQREPKSFDGLPSQKQLNQEGPFSKDLIGWPDKAAKSPNSHITENGCCLMLLAISALAVKRPFPRILASPPCGSTPSSRIV